MLFHISFLKTHRKFFEQHTYDQPKMIRSKLQPSNHFKFILIGFFFLIFLLFLSKSSFQWSKRNLEIPEWNSTQIPSTCTKIPPSLANALIHYATTNITPQQTFKEVSVSARVFARRGPCNFLVFGLGRDSVMWAALNHGGRTVFLEEDAAWIDQIKQNSPDLEIYHVEYDTKVKQADVLFQMGMREECTAVGDPRSSVCRLAHKGFPDDIYNTEWDLIMVDAPTGYYDGAPGRMTAIYTAGLMARNRAEGETDVFVHDVNRVVEDKFSKAFLCEGYFKEEEGLLRHFTIPSHRNRPGTPFCPN